MIVEVDSDEPPIQEIRGDDDTIEPSEPEGV
jgi:hypothetical protein